MIANPPNAPRYGVKPSRLHGQGPAEVLGGTTPYRSTRTRITSIPIISVSLIVNECKDHVPL